MSRVGNMAVLSNIWQLLLNTCCHVVMYVSVCFCCTSVFLLLFCFPLMFDVFPSVLFWNPNLFSLFSQSIYDFWTAVYYCCFYLFITKLVKDPYNQILYFYSTNLLNWFFSAAFDKFIRHFYNMFGVEACLS